MPIDPIIASILGDTPLYTEVSVSKMFDLAEEVSLALERSGRTPEWLAEKAGMTMEKLTGLLSGMDPIYDPIARLEAAFEVDLFIGATQCKYYFQNDDAGFNKNAGQIQTWHKRILAQEHKEYITNSPEYTTEIIWHNEAPSNTGDNNSSLFKGNKSSKVSLIKLSSNG